MVKGIGVDILEVSRFKLAIERTGNAFARKIFTEREYDYCTKRKDNLLCFAARFAAKEATLKAFGFGLVDAGLKSIELINLDSGAPIIKLKGKLLAEKKKRKIGNIFVSISHSQNYVIAFVILE